MIDTLAKATVTTKDGTELTVTVHRVNPGYGSGRCYTITEGEGPTPCFDDGPFRNTSQALAAATAVAERYQHVNEIVKAGMAAERVGIEAADMADPWHNPPTGS